MEFGGIWDSSGLAPMGAPGGVHFRLRGTQGVAAERVFVRPAARKGAEERNGGEKKLKAVDLARSHMSQFSTGAGDGGNSG